MKKTLWVTTLFVIIICTVGVYLTFALLLVSDKKGEVSLNEINAETDFETLKSILKVDKEVWEKEASEIEEHYKKFGDKLPQVLREQLNSLKAKLADM